MTRTVVALYDDLPTANDAIHELVNNGVSRSDISLIANDQSGEYSRYLHNSGDATEMPESGAATGAGVGAGIGAVIGGLGGLLVGLGALAVPGIGPLLAAGPLAAALGGLAGAGAGAVAGGVTGGLIGALADMGIPNENAGYFAEGIRRGGILVVARTNEEMANTARDILNRHNPVDMNERVSLWRESGWGGYTPTEVEPTIPATVQRDPAEISSSTSYSYSDYPAHEGNFRTHFDSSMYAGSYTFDQYQPAYRYGYDLATNDQYHDRNWDDIEYEARTYWDERDPGTWERIKDAVRYAWEEVKSAVD